jgi:SPP1 family predicted phage head-tail adaptor
MTDVLFAALRNSAFEQSRLSRVSDGQGGWARAYVDLGEVAGRIRPASAQEREVALQEQRHITHVLYVEAGEDIERGDRLEYIAGDSDRVGLLFEIQGVREPSIAGHHLEIDCLEVQKEQQGEAGS